VNGWSRARLDECCEVIGGATPRSEVAAYWGGEINWATPKDLSELKSALITDTPRKLTEAGLRSCSASVLPPGSVLFSSRAPIGLVAVNAARMATNQGFKSLIPKPDRVHATFLYWWLRVNRPYLESLGNGATFKELSKAAVSRIEVPLPPLPEQRRISAILDQADALRAKRRAAIAQIDPLAQSIFLDMFGDPTDNPVNWPRRRLRDLCSSISDIDHKMPPPVDSGIPLISAKDLMDDGAISFASAKRISEADFERLSRKGRPTRGDIVYSRYGTVGKSRLVRTDAKFLASYSCCTIKPMPDQVDAVFLCHLLDSPSTLQQAKRGTRGTGIPDLGLKTIMEFLLIAPPLKEQREFARRVASLDGLRTTHRCSLAQLNALFASLQHRAFRGEL